MAASDSVWLFRDVRLTGAGLAAGVRSTPTLFINGRRYHGPYESDKYLMLWVEEEIAVAQ